MKKIIKITYIIISIALLQLLFFFSIPMVKAETSIPDDFNQDLDLDQVYIYNVTSFNTTKYLEWWGLDWTIKGFANTTPRGQIKVNFTGFYNKDPNDFYNIFKSPMVYMDVEFIENSFGTLVTNTTFYNVSNGEADSNLAFGYNQFKSGFLIPINNISGLKEQAYAQDVPSYMNATITIEETATNITFNFQQESGFQNTDSTYDKISGLLIYTNTNVGNYTLEMTLTNAPSYPSDDGSESIPSFQIYIICGTSASISIIYVIKLKRKK